MYMCTRESKPAKAAPPVRDTHSHQENGCRNHLWADKGQALVGPGPCGPPWASVGPLGPHGPGF